LSVVKKTVCSGCGQAVSGFWDRRTHVVGDLDAGATRICRAFEYRRVTCPQCKAVKRETLTWLAKSARFTQQRRGQVLIYSLFFSNLFAVILLTGA